MEIPYLERPSLYWDRVQVFENVEAFAIPHSGGTLFVAFICMYVFYVWRGTIMCDV